MEDLNNRAPERAGARQRALDLAICILALPLLLVIGAVIALAVFLDSPGPVLYRAPRIGRGGRPFSMFKFRTMRHGASGPPLSTAEDDRHTPLGRWLSRHRLDELPQVVNVLRGDMRLVGPRPEVAEFVDAYPAQYERILSVLPGITGPAQLHFAAEGELLATAEDRIAAYRDSILPAKIDIDLAYAERSSLRRDVRILWRTAALPMSRLYRRAALVALTRPVAAPGTRVATALSVVATLIVALFAVETFSA